jgi:methionyl-tRNA formyltransferase
MRCIVFAYSQLGYGCLKELIQQTDCHVVGVFTHAEKQGEHIWFDSVAVCAKAAAIPVFTPESLKNDTAYEQVSDLKPDALFSFYYRLMIPERILMCAPLGAFNMHGSLLPRYRGRAPVNWALINGETQTGVTLHYMVKAADAGDIVDQRATPIGPDECAGDVMMRLNHLAVESLRHMVPLIGAGKAPRIIQNHADSTYFGGRTHEDGRIEWTWSSTRIHNMVRALQPSPQYPPAFGAINGKKVSIIHSKRYDPDRASPLSPGTIVYTDGTMLLIACGSDGTDRIFIRVQDCPVTS